MARWDGSDSSLVDYARALLGHIDADVGPRSKQEFEDRWDLVSESLDGLDPGQFVSALDRVLSSIERVLEETLIRDALSRTFFGYPSGFYDAITSRTLEYLADAPPGGRDARVIPACREAVADMYFANAESAGIPPGDREAAERLAHDYLDIRWGSPTEHARELDTRDDFPLDVALVLRHTEDDGCHAERSEASAAGSLQRSFAALRMTTRQDHRGGVLGLGHVAKGLRRAEMQASLPRLRELEQGLVKLSPTREELWEWKRKQPITFPPHRSPLDAFMMEGTPATTLGTLIK